MQFTSAPFDRRKFLQSGALLAVTAATTGLLSFDQRPGIHPLTTDEELYMLGPRKGYSPYIGSLVSMLNYNRSTILNLTKSMTVEQLDHLQDAQSNSIGALLMHLAAVDKYYYINTFEKRDLSDDEKKTWWDAIELGDKGRQLIKGKELSYYVDLLTTTREQTLQALKGKDDDWLLAVDPQILKTSKININNYWKWFHVCEHEAHHRGQISWLKKRIPGMKGGND